MQSLLTTLALPPIGLLLLALLGALLAARGRRRAGWLAVLASLLLLVLAMPLVATVLTVGLERAVPPPLTEQPPAAIVILGGEVTRGAEGMMPGPLTLRRLNRGAALARETGLPVLVSGGRLAEDDPETLAAVMTRTLKQDFAIAPRWLETASADTRENAAFSTDLLRRDSIGAAWLVTDGWHMARAAEAFRRAGFTVRAAPVILTRQPYPVTARDFVPQADALNLSWLMLREWAGRLVYALRDR